MAKALLFLPDISGFTAFVQSTEIAHSQHVIAELLEVLIQANTQQLLLAEIEGDALFFYKEEIPSLEKLLAQVETMFTAFYSHLKLMEKNRICPCNACATAPNLELKIVAHSGDIEFLQLQDKRKPFGPSVIAAHRLLKNSVASDNYVLFSQDLMNEIALAENYSSKLYQFQSGVDNYDQKDLNYAYAIISKDHLKLKPHTQAKMVSLKTDPLVKLNKKFPLKATALLEYITNYNYRHHWQKGVKAFEYNEHEITRLGSEHVCIINEKHFNILAVTKAGLPEQLIYGEYTTDPAPVDAFYVFYIITPLSTNSCNLEIEVYAEAKSIFKKIMLKLVVKKAFQKNLMLNLQNLYQFTTSKD